MTWLTWRQLRVQATVVYAAVAAAALVLVVTAPEPAAGMNVYDQLTRTDRNLYVAGIVVLALAPAVIGAFWGAPLVARELEGGTHRLVWNQSVTRTRWLATRLGIAAAATAAATGLLSLVVTWWAGPIDGVLGTTRGSLPSRLTPVAFAMRGVAPIGYAVFALVLGVAAGIVLRRTVPAMAAALALFAFVQIAVPLWVRPHLVPPAVRTVDINRETLDGISFEEPGSAPTLTVAGGAGNWVLSNETVDPSGRVGLPSWFVTCVPRPGPPSEVEGGPGAIKGRLDTCIARLAADGYRQRLVYQPASRFWPLQWAETGMFLAASALLAWFCFRRIRRLS